MQVVEQNKLKQNFWKNKLMPIEKKQQPLTPGEKAKIAILADRLGIGVNEAYQIQTELSGKLAKTLGLMPHTVKTKIEPAGRDLDMVFIINKQNLPKKKI